MTEETRISPWSEVLGKGMGGGMGIWEIRRGNGRVFGIRKSRILLGHIRIGDTSR